MVSACQQNSGIFLVRGGGLGAGCRRGPRLGPGQDAGDQITGQAADSERPGTGRDTGGKITGQVADSERPGTGREICGGRG